MKKRIAFLLCCAFVLALSGCAGTTVVVGECTCPSESHTQAAVPGDLPPAGTLKLGLAIVPDISKSVPATADANGKAEFDVTVVAVTVDANGIIHDCIIDSLSTSAEFAAAGNPVNIAPGSTGAANAVQVLTKNELGFDYGMAKASKTGKEWFQQAAALAEFAQNKTVAQVQDTYASDVDLATSASIKLDGYVAAMEAAVANAVPLGGETGHKLKLAVTASLETSAMEAGGMAQLYLDAVALTMMGDVITACTIDSLQAPVEFDGTGAITTDLSSAPRTKNQLGAAYGMARASKIGVEWNEQVVNFCAYVSGMTAEEVAGIRVTEEKKPADADLAAECTIAIGSFQTLVAKAVN